MTEVNPRELAIRYIQDALDGKETERSENVSEKDRALYQELSLGSLREWRFLEWVISGFSKKKPKRKVLLLLIVGSYQLLFLDRVPAFAIFSEMKKLSLKFKLSTMEIKFLTAILKKIEGNKEGLLEKRAEALEHLKENESFRGLLDYAILNVSEELITLLSWQGKRKAIDALLEMKQKPAIVGYALDKNAINSDTVQAMNSTVAPRALLLKTDDIFNKEVFRVQGEASQWACEQVAQWIQEEQSHTSDPIRVLELAAGKGGKLLGTLAALGVSYSKPLHWIVSDKSKVQLNILEQEVQPLIKKYWPHVQLEIIHELTELKKVDFIWIDAPCTGFGTIAKLPQIAVRAHEPRRQSQELFELQKHLVEKSKPFLKPSGRLVYSVCTLTEAETNHLMTFAVKIYEKKIHFQQFLWPGQKPAPYAEGFYLSALK